MRVYASVCAVSASLQSDDICCDYTSVLLPAVLKCTNLMTYIHLHFVNEGFQFLKQDFFFFYENTQLQLF